MSLTYIPNPYHAMQLLKSSGGGSNMSSPPPNLQGISTSPSLPSGEDEEPAAKSPPRFAVIPGLPVMQETQVIPAARVQNGNSQREGNEEERIYNCPLCREIIHSQRLFTQHIRGHNDVKPADPNPNDPTGQDKIYYCCLCKKALSSFSSLDRHMLVHSGERPFSCEYCNQTFTTNGNMHRHKRTHNENTRKSQESDASSLGSSGGNKRTGRKRKSPPANAEQQQQKNAARSPKFSNNELMSSSSDFPQKNTPLMNSYSPVKCPVCPQYFLESQLATHVIDAHPNTPLPCGQCAFVSEDFPIYACHKELHNELQNPLVSHDAKFIALQNMQKLLQMQNKKPTQLLLPEPQETEKEDKRFTIDEIIGKENMKRASELPPLREEPSSSPGLLIRAASLSDLNTAPGQLTPKSQDTSSQSESIDHDAWEGVLREMKLKGEFPCRVCGIKYANLRALKGHNKEHTKDPPYACNVAQCDFDSSDKSNLSKHMRCHTGEKPFECKLCKFGFTTKANCERHVKNKHNRLSRTEIRESIVLHEGDDTSASVDKDESLLASPAKIMKKEPSRQHDINPAKGGAGHAQVIPCIPNAFKDLHYPEDINEKKMAAREVRSDSPDNKPLDLTRSPPASLPSPSMMVYPSPDLAAAAAAVGMDSHSMNFMRQIIMHQNSMAHHPLAGNSVAQNPAALALMVQIQKQQIAAAQAQAVQVAQAQAVQAAQAQAAQVAQAAQAAQVAQAQAAQAAQVAQAAKIAQAQFAAMAQDKILLEQFSQRTGGGMSNFLQVPPQSLNPLLQAHPPPTKPAAFSAAALSNGINYGKDLKAMMNNGVLTTKPKQTRYRADTPYKCDFCDTSFTMESNRKRHILNKHPEQLGPAGSSSPHEKQALSAEEEELDIGDAFDNVSAQDLTRGADSPHFSTKPNCDRHSTQEKHDEMYNNNNNRSHFNCPQCDFISSSHLELNEHQTSLNHFEDDVNNSSCLDNSNTSNISSSSSGECSYRCHLCDEAFPEKSECLSHVQQEHHEKYNELLAKGAFEECGRAPSPGGASGEDSNFTKARATIPEYKNRKVICFICDRRFHSAEDLRRHTRTHTKETPYTCKQCDKHFSLKHSYVRHMKSRHEGTSSGESSDPELNSNSGISGGGGDDSSSRCSRRSSSPEGLDEKTKKKAANLMKSINKLKKECPE